MDRDDKKFKARFKQIPDFAPRPGFEQRFWARVQTQPQRRLFWQWLPVAATALGLVFGLVAGQFRSSGPDTHEAAGLTAKIGLPENSLAGLFGSNH
jgi:hypothetical protein